MTSASWTYRSHLSLCLHKVFAKCFAEEERKQYGTKIDRLRDFEAPSNDKGLPNTTAGPQLSKLPSRQKKKRMHSVLQLERVTTEVMIMEPPTSTVGMCKQPWLLDTPLGDILRLLTRGHVVKFPEEREEFAFSEDGRECKESTVHQEPTNSVLGIPLVPEVVQPGKALAASLRLEARSGTYNLPPGQPIPSKERVVERDASYEPQDETVPTDWYGPNDTANPKNFSMARKTQIFLTIGYGNAAVYLSSSIYGMSQPGFMAEFDVSATRASLGLALFVLGYGFGPLFLSPLSDVSWIGRNPPYFISSLIFLIISVLTAMESTFEGILVLRFLQGFFGSPLISFGGASLTDICSEDWQPFALYTWACSGFAAASIAPIISGFAVPVLGWRWSLWEIVLANVPSLFLLLILPETSASKILHARAQRLCALKPKVKFRSVLDKRQGRSPKESFFRSFVIPWQMHALDPSILFTSIFTGLVYGIFYSFFEVLPLVYEGIYGFHGGMGGLPYLSMVLGVVVAGAPYSAYIHFYINFRHHQGFKISPEKRLIPAIVASLLLPSGMFVFAWTARSNVHWMIPTLGVALTSAGVVVILQCIFVYISCGYPQYSASAFGANGCVRSFVAFAALLWSRPLYHSLGISGGSSLLGGLCLLGTVGVLILYIYGVRLRELSRFAT